MTGWELSVDELGPVGDVVRREAGFVVHELPELRLPDVDGPLVLKTYATGRGTPPGLRGAVQMRATVPLGLRERVDRAVQWPVRTVTRADVLRGVVQARVPEPFVQELRLPSGRAGRVPRDAQFLFAAPARTAALGLPPVDEHARWGICLALAAALTLAHEPPLEFALSEIDARTVLWSVAEEPAVLIADGDGIRLRTSSAPARRGTSPDWDPPADDGGPGADPRATDVYKLGLFVLRCLCPGPFASVLRDPDVAAGRLDPAGAALLRRTLSGAAAERPSAKEWRAHLAHRLGRAIEPPVVTDVRLDRTIVAAGEPVAVSWTATEAAAVEVTGPGLPAVRVDGWSTAGTVEIRPARTGRLHVTAHNALGAHTRITGPVAVVDVPRTGSLPVPVPDLAWPLAEVAAPLLPAVAAPPLAATAPPGAAAFWPSPPPPSAPPPPGFGIGTLAFPFDLTELFRTRATGSLPIPSQRGGEA